MTRKERALIRKHFRRLDSILNELRVRVNVEVSEAMTNLVLEVCSASERVVRSRDSLLRYCAQNSVLLKSGRWEVQKLNELVEEYSSACSKARKGGR